MKVIITIFLFLFFSCTSVPKAFIQTDSSCHFQDSIFLVSNKNLVFNVDDYYNEEKPIGTISILKNSNEEIKLVRWEKNKPFIYKHNLYTLNIQKALQYNSQGHLLKSWFTYLSGSTKIYKEIHFDEQGNITKVIDYEKGYNICWAEAIELAKRKAKRRIKKNNITSFFLHRVDVSRSPNAQTKWRVILDGSDEFNSTDSVSYWFDGKTCEFLYEKYYKPAID